MRKTIHVIIDNSGSMNEMGKIFIQKNLCRYLNQLKAIGSDKYLDVDIRFFKWSQNISEIVIQADGHVPELFPEGSSDLIDLADFLSNKLSEEQSLSALVLSDGNFTNSDIVSFKKQLNSHLSPVLRSVAVGADSDLLKLKKISSNGTVYLSEDISAAISSTVLGHDKHLPGPETTDQILLNEISEPEEDWDV